MIFENDFLYYGMDSPEADKPSKIFRCDKITFEKTIVGEAYNGLPIYGLTKTYLPRGFIVWYSYEPSFSLPVKDGDYIPIDFFDYSDNKLKTIAKIPVNASLASKYLGFYDSSRYQCKRTGIICTRINNDFMKYLYDTTDYSVHTPALIHEITL